MALTHSGIFLFRHERTKAQSTTHAIGDDLIK